MWTNPQSVGDALKFQFKNVQLYQNLFLIYKAANLESEKFKVAIYKAEFTLILIWKSCFQDRKMCQLTALFFVISWLLSPDEKKPASRI